MRAWTVIARMFVGPVCLAMASAFRGWPEAALLACGSLVTLAASVLTLRHLSRASARSAAEGILATAVEFLHASGVKKVRANFMRINESTGALEMQYKSTAYGLFEVENLWHLGDGSCASSAIEFRVPVLGGHTGEWQPVDPDVTFTVKVMPMKVLPGEEIRSVLCLPVPRSGHSDPIGVICFDDVLPLSRSRLTDPAILTAAKIVADSFSNAVPMH